MFRATIASLVILGFAPAAAATQQPDVSATYTQLKYRYIGPVGNRVSAVAGVAGDASVYYAEVVHAYGPQQQRGIYRTMEGGKTWERVLFVEENTGAAVVVMDQTKP